MFVRFTPKQIQKTKDFLKSSKLTGYDVSIYQEILKALDHPIDEKDMKKRYDIVKEKIIKVDQPIQQAPVAPVIPESTNNIIESIEPPNMKVDEGQSSMTHWMNKMKPTSPSTIDQPVINEEDLVVDEEPILNVQQPPAPPTDAAPTSDQLEEAGMFGVVDSRTK